MPETCFLKETYLATMLAGWQRHKTSHKHDKEQVFASQAKYLGPKAK